MVVPLVGTWIEIGPVHIVGSHQCVVPLVGTWIEILFLLLFLRHNHVVPLVGTWIEIQLQQTRSTLSTRRSPCGNVD